MIKKTLLSAILVAGCMTAAAQEQAKTEYVFNPHWYVQGHVGGQYTLGEVGFGDLLSPNVQLGVGYNFNPVVGARFALDAWQSKAGSEINSNKYTWKWKYVAPTIDATFNLSNLICGYNPERLVSVGVFAGLGLNVGFSNDDAQDVNKKIIASYPAYNGDQALRNLWNGTKVRLFGQLGANVDFRLDDQWKVGLELQANTLNDHYNSKKAGNADWYFNALVGVKYTIGKSYSKSTAGAQRTANPTYNDQQNERVVEKVVEKRVEVEKQQPLRRDIFFTIASTKITIAEMQKVKEIADYLKKYPNAKVEITGYADKGTGNKTINSRLSAQRAKVVVDALVNNYGISSGRITSSSKGDSVQPFSEQVLNRVSICIAQ